MGNPANYLSPVALRPRLATGLPFSFDSRQRGETLVSIKKRELFSKEGAHNLNVRFRKLSLWSGSHGTC